MIRIKINALPSQIKHDMFLKWWDHRDYLRHDDVTGQFNEFITEYFGKMNIDVFYYDVDMHEFEDDDIVINSKDLTWLHMKYN